MYSGRFKFQYFPFVNEIIPGSNEYGWQYMDLDNQPQCVKVAYETSNSIYPTSNKRDEVEEVPDEKPCSFSEDSQLKEDSISEVIDSKCETANMTKMEAFDIFLYKESINMERICAELDI